MRVWLDDLRDPARYPVGEVVWVKTAPAAIALLETGQVSWISLDNDLGEDEPEGAEGPEPEAKEADRTGRTLKSSTPDARLVVADGMDRNVVNISAEAAHR